MKTLKYSVIFLGVFLLLGGASYLYASNGFKSKAGYADINTLTEKMGAPLLSIKLGRNGTKQAYWLFEQLDDDLGFESQKSKRVLKNVLAELQATQLKVFDIKDNRHEFEAAISHAVASLKSKQWQTMASIKQEDVKIEVMHYLHKEQLAGLSFIMSTPEKAMFLNLIGPFDSARIGKLSSN